MGMRSKVRIGIAFMEKLEKFIAKELDIQHEQVVVGLNEVDEKYGDIRLQVELQKCEPTVK